MYWILSNELVNEESDANLSGSFSTDFGNEIAFDEGEAMPLPISKATFKLDNADPIGNLTDHLSVDEVPGLIFSARLRELLHNLMVTNIQYVDLDLLDTSNSVISDSYKIANIVGVADCVDREKSNLTYFDDGDIKFIKKLVLDYSMIPSDLKLFRLANDRTLPLVHQTIKNAIVGSGITGCVFYRPEEFH